MRDDLETVLVCAECGKESEGGARCWRPLLTVDDELATYCPTAHERISAMPD